MALLAVVVEGQKTSRAGFYRAIQARTGQRRPVGTGPIATDRRNVAHAIERDDAISNVMRLCPPLYFASVKATSCK